MSKHRARLRGKNTFELNKKKNKKKRKKLTLLPSVILNSASYKSTGSRFAVGTACNKRAFIFLVG
jgi:hypothetical protein